MIIVSVFMTALPGKRGDLLDRARAMVDATRMEAGCISYGFYADPQDADKVLVFEQWESREALNAHMKTAHFLDFGRDAGPLRHGSKMTLFEAKEIG